MSLEPNLTCSTCGMVMEVLTDEGEAPTSDNLRVCPVCGTLAWTNEDGTIEMRVPQKVEGEEHERRTRDMKVVSFEEERARIREILRRQAKPRVQ
jgi:hypothetical protein